MSSGSSPQAAARLSGRHQGILGALDEGLMPPEAAADEAEALLERGFTAVKLRLGRADFQGDLTAYRT